MANLASAAFGTAVLSAICGTNQTAILGGQTLGLHSSNPGINGAGAVAGVARKPITWKTGQIGGGGAAMSTITGDPIEFSVGPGTYTHYGVFNSSNAFLYGKPLSASVTVPAGATGTITVTPSHTYDLT